jgi:aspartokinase-like uncharacterized kinase
MAELSPRSPFRPRQRRPTRCLPHAWAATSDSLAGRVAVVCGARRLVLLKSVTVPPAVGWAEAGRLGLVDALLADVLRQRPDLEVEAVNLRAWPG